MSAQCSHLSQIKLTSTDEKACPECVKLGDTWVHQHPLVRSIEPGQAWV
jgi:hypothetical protein